MKSINVIVITVLLALLNVTVRAEIVIVVNADSSIEKLSYTEVARIYTGRHLVIANGEPIEPFDHPVNSDLRARFYNRLLNKTVAEMNSYWARLLFSGRAKPPRQLLAGLSEIDQILKNNSNAIVYIDSVAAKKLSNAKIIYVLPDKKY